LNIKDWLEQSGTSDVKLYSDIFTFSTEDFLEAGKQLISADKIRFNMEINSSIYFSDYWFEDYF